jgi:hypothetical protein
LTSLTTRPEVSVDCLRLEVFRVHGEDNSDGIELRLMNENGLSIMALKLPESAIQAITKIGASWHFTMSPNGSLTIYCDDEVTTRRQGIGLDELIQQSLAPDMLEDEPQVLAELKELKRKLTASLAIVDSAISALPQDEF